MNVPAPPDLPYDPGERRMPPGEKRCVQSSKP